MHSLSPSLPLPDSNSDPFSESTNSRNSASSFLTLRPCPFSVVQSAFRVRSESICSVHLPLTSGRCCPWSWPLRSDSIRIQSVYRLSESMYIPSSTNTFTLNMVTTRCLVDCGSIYRSNVNVPFQPPVLSMNALRPRSPPLVVGECGTVSIPPHSPFSGLMAEDERRIQIASFSALFDIINEPFHPLHSSPWPLRLLTVSSVFAVDRF